MCKVCDLKFSKKNTDLKPLKLLCPYCGRVLSFKKKRKNFNIHKCVNNSCPYYANALKSLSPEDLLEYEKDEHKFKLRYIYREFTIDFFKVDLSTMPKGAVNFNFRKFSPHIMGLCLTYYVNLGLSTRATARALLNCFIIGHDQTSVIADSLTCRNLECSYYVHFIRLSKFKTSLSLDKS